MRKYQLLNVPSGVITDFWQRSPLGSLPKLIKDENAAQVKRKIQSLLVILLGKTLIKCGKTFQLAYSKGANADLPTGASVFISGLTTHKGAQPRSYVGV